MRQFKRHAAILIAEARPFKNTHKYAEASLLKKTHKYSVGITSNFSQDGICFESQSLNPKPMEILEFKLKHPQSDLSFSALGEIVWKKETRYGHKMGIKFSEIEQATKGKLLELISTDRKYTELSIHNKKIPNKDLPTFENEATDNLDPTMMARQKNKRKKRFSYMSLVVFFLVFFLMTVPFVSENIRREFRTFISTGKSMFSQDNDKRMVNVTTDDKHIKDLSKQELIEPVQAEQKLTEAGQRNEVSAGNNQSYVQVGAWKNLNYAETALSKIKQYYPDAYIFEQNDFYKIRIPGILTKKQGAIVSNDIEKKFDLKPMLVLKNQ